MAPLRGKPLRKQVTVAELQGQHLHYFRLSQFTGAESLLNLSSLEIEM